jgi:hypothetical protein
MLVVVVVVVVLYWNQSGGVSVVLMNDSLQGRGRRRHGCCEK